MSTPIVVRAYLRGPVAWRSPVHLDALLGWVVAQEKGLRPEDPIDDLPLPLVRVGAVWVATAGVLHTAEAVPYEAHVQRRPIVGAAQQVGDARLRRVDIAAGANKGTRQPEARAVVTGWAQWAADATDVAEVERLLAHVRSVGARRGIGCGEVERWEITEHPGPVALVDAGGAPLRLLPSEWPGLSAALPREMVRVSPPYHAPGGRVLGVQPAVREVRHGAGGEW